MRRALATVVCASLVFGGAGSSAAAGAEPSPSAEDAPEDDAILVERAEQAWSRGDWGLVRAVLEPVAQQPDRLTDPRLREKGLCLLADALVNDAELDEQERREQASAYLELLLEADPDWRLPPAIYSPDLFELFVAVQDRRSQQTSIQCEADRNACEADLAASDAELRDMQRRFAALEQRFADQDVEVRDRVARSRIFAAVPFGIGQFYNGEPLFGGLFLGIEAAAGATGLTLLLYRSVGDGCRRESGFQRGSLICANRDLDAILRRRKTEEAMGWVFLGTMVLDVIWAQYRFKPFKTQSVERVPRRLLDAEGGGESGPARRRRRRRGPRAKVRPTGGGDRHGATLGVSVRF